MSGCHVPTNDPIEIPAMSRLEVSEDNRRLLYCIGCNESARDCVCIWAAIRDLQAQHKVLQEHHQSVDNMRTKTNALIHKRLMDLEESYRGLFHDYSYLEDAVAVLRTQAKEPSQQFDEVVNEILHVEARLKHRCDTLEQLIINNVVVRNKPHKCPVCDGKYIAMFKECESACLACDKGIVWG